MRLIHTDGYNKDFYGLCEQLDKSLDANVPDRKAAGLNSLYKIENLRDVFILYHGDKPIGCASLWLHDATCCEIIRVFVSDEYRGKGLVSKLVEKVEKLAIEKGYKKIMLRTYSCTPYAVRAYEKLGYKPVDKGSVKHPDKFAKALALASLRVYMEKDLI
jgi:predicted GNAT family acetyltransferase